MLKTNVTTNISGQVIIADSNGEKQVAYMNATVSVYSGNIEPSARGFRATLTDE